MLFDETQNHISPSSPVPSELTLPLRDLHQLLPLHFGAQPTAVPSSTVFDAPAPSLPPEGSPAIAASSPGNFAPSVPLFSDSLQAVDPNPAHPNPHPGDNRTGSFLDLPLSLSHDTTSRTANPLPNPNLTNPNPTNPQPQRTHTMTTRSMNQIFKPKQIHTVSKHPLPPTIEPTSVSQAISQPHWREAMSTEITALMKHGTWDLVLPTADCKPVGCKWIFRVKRKADGSVDKFKARLVAKGYNQRPGVDYTETFSPVVKPATIRAVLSIAVMNGWNLRQMNVNNAFLNGDLTETVFMAQPPGFKDLSKPHHVCRLKKAIYGLKQAPRAWYTALKTAILQLGFRNSKADSSLFIYSHGSTLCYLLVYVDDLIITGNNPSLVTSIIKQLGDKFSLKDMGSLHFFLGIKVIPTRAGLFLS